MGIKQGKVSIFSHSRSMDKIFVFVDSLSVFYTNYLNYTQTKDNKFIHPPPFKFTNLKLSTQKCNLDEDIFTIKPTIQIHGLETNIHYQNGNYITTITTERLQWLWNCYTHNNLPQLMNVLRTTSITRLQNINIVAHTTIYNHTPQEKNQKTYNLTINTTQYTLKSWNY